MTTNLISFLRPTELDT